MKKCKGIKEKNTSCFKAKFVHFMGHGSLIYNKQIIEMINNEEEFNPSDHLFIILKKPVFDQNCKYDNVIYNDKVYSNINEFKKYADNCEFIFLHSYFSNYKMLFLNPKYLKKIVWIEWGHDLYAGYKKSENQSFMNKILNIPVTCIRKIIKKLREMQQKHFYAIGIGPKYDAIEVKRRYGDRLRILNIPYGYVKNNIKNMETSIKDYNENHKKDDINESIKVMVGHSAYPFINHEEILKKLEKYKNENILISLVLAYGDQEYAKKIKKIVSETWPKEKVEIIDKMVDRNQYIKYLCSVDIAIITYKHQSGMGNFYDLLYLGKKIFLNPKGYIKLISTLEGFETYNYTDIDNMDFESFSKPTMAPQEGMKFAKDICDENYYIRRWKSTINELDNNLESRKKDE